MQKITKITKLEGWLSFIIWVSLPMILRIPGLAQVLIVALTIIMLGKNKRIIDYRVSKKEIWKMILIILFALIIQILWGLFSTKVLKIMPDSQNQKMIVDTLTKGGWGAVSMIFGVLITAPLMEELVFRGWIQEYISRNKKMGFAVSWLLFAAIHLIASMFVAGSTLNKLLIEFVPYGVISFIFCWYYYKYESIGKNIILHFINNFIAVILVFLPLLF